MREVFGAKAAIQRCTVHKRRNVADHLPDKEQAWVDAKLVKAFDHPDPDAGLRNAKGPARQLEKNYPGAAASLREGLQEMFTVARLGIDGRLAKTLTTSNPIESMISIARTTNRNVTRWRDGQMVLRWTAAGMLNAERSFRRIKGYKQMPQLVAALHRHAHPDTADRRRNCRCRRLEFTVDRHPNSTRLGTCSVGTRRTLQINSKGEVQAVPTSRARAYPLDRGVLRAPQAANRRSNDHRSLQKKSYDAVSAALPFAIDPAKITVEPGVSYLPSPIKLDGHAAGVAANRHERKLQRQKDIIRSEFGPACGWAVKGVHYD